MAITKIQSESLNLADDYTFTGNIVGAGGANTPAFLARLSSNLTVATSTVTTLPFTDDSTSPKAFDTDNAFNTTTYTFTVPSGQAGKYYFYVTARFDQEISADRCNIELSLNNSGVNVEGEQQGHHQFFTVSLSGSLILSVGDAIKVNVFQDAGENKTVRSDVTYFGGYKIIE